MKMKKTTHEMIREYRDFMTDMISVGFARYESMQRSEATKRGIALVKARKQKNQNAKKRLRAKVKMELDY